MPELPEVETVRAYLAPALEGRTFSRVEIHDARLAHPLDPCNLAAELEGELVSAVRRRGKYLIVLFGSGRSLLVHLRMTGSFRHAPGGTLADDPYRRAVVRLDDGSDVAYRDVRRFGTWLLLDDAQALKGYLGARLGPEPLAVSFTAKRLGTCLGGSRAPLKAALLDQRRLAGVGNIYADEALWRARLHPRHAAGGLSPLELRRLHRGIRDALRTGIERQGSTLRDYRAPDGVAGSMQDEFAVYGRDGEPCRRCGSPITKTRIAGRGTWLCPRCQRLPAADG